MASSSGSNSSKEDEILLKSVEANMAKHDVEELDMEDDSGTRTSRKHCCKISKENLFVVMTLIGSKYCELLARESVNDGFYVL